MSKIRFNAEKDLEESICDFIDEHGRCPLTNRPVTHWYRQIRIGSYGIADIVKIYIDEHKCIEITVLELKNEAITIEGIAQVSRYASGILHFISNKFKRIGYYITVDAELLGSDFKSSDDICFLHNHLNDHIDVYTFDLSISKGFEVKKIRPEWKRDCPEFNKDASFIIEDIRDSVRAL